MRKIYYKEGEHINNKQEYILNFLPTKNNFFPPTFYKNSGFIQCRSMARRSFNDIFWLLKSKFKTATRGELARILLDKRLCKADMIYCDNANKLVIGNAKSKDLYPNYSFINTGDIKERPLFLDQKLITEGPFFEEVVKYATRSNKFNIKNVKFSLEEHKDKYLK